MQITVDDRLIHHITHTFGLSPSDAVERGLKALLESLEDAEDAEQARKVLADIEAGREKLVPWEDVLCKMDNQ